MRQLTGAIVGGTLALGIYYTYEAGAPVVTAWLSVPQDQFSVEDGSTVIQTDLNEEERRRISQRARFIVDTFGNEVPIPEPAKPVPANWDVDAIESDLSGWEVEASQDEDSPNQPFDTAQDGSGQAEEVEERTEEDGEDNVWNDNWIENEETPAEMAYVEEVEAPVWNDSPWAAEVAEVTQIQSASTLTDSGIGLWIATLGTLCGTAFLHRRRILECVRP